MTRRKITKKVKIHNAMYLMKCPACGETLTSASQIDLLPKFAYCDNKNCNY